MGSLGRDLLVLAFVSLVVGRLGAEDVWFESKLGSPGDFVQAFAFDPLGNPNCLVFETENNKNVFKSWANDHWEEEITPIPYSGFMEMSFDSSFQPHLTTTLGDLRKHIFRTMNGWQTEDLPLSPQLSNFENPDAPQIARVMLSTTIPNSLEIQRGFKGPNGWQTITVSTTGAGGYVKGGVIHDDGTLYIAVRDQNHLRIVKCMDQSLETILDVTLANETVLGFGVEPPGQYHVLTSSRAINFPPLTIQEGLNINSTDEWQYSEGIWYSFKKDQFISSYFQYIQSELSGGQISTETMPAIYKFGFYAVGGICGIRKGSKPFEFGNAVHFTEGGNDVFILSVMMKLPPPAPASVSARTSSSIRWTWPGRTSSIVTGYHLRRAGDNADLSGLLPGTATGWTQEGLGPNTFVSAYLETISPGFVLPSTPIAAASAGIAANNVHLSRDQTGRFSAAWSGQGNPSGTNYRLDFKASDGTVLSVSAGSPACVIPFLPMIPYAMNIAVISSDGSEVPMAAVESVSSDSAQTRMSFAVNGSTVDAALFPTEGHTPPVLAAAPVFQFPGNNDRSLTPTGRGFQLEMDHPLPEDQHATVSVAYPADWLGSPLPGPFVLALYDSARDSWTPLPTRQNGRRLTADASGFGIFQVMGRGGAADLGKMTAYPNPFRPSDGGTVVLREVPSDAHVNVFALDGRLIRTLSGQETGLAEWDGRDEAGGIVKSGVYVIALKRNGETKKMKVIVER